MWIKYPVIVYCMQFIILWSIHTRVHTAFYCVQSYKYFPSYWKTCILPPGVKGLNFLVKICSSLYYQTDLIIRHIVTQKCVLWMVKWEIPGVPGIATGMGTFHVHWTFKVLPHLAYASCVIPHTSAVSLIHSYSVSYFQGHGALGLYHLSSLIFPNILLACHQGDRVPLSLGSNEYISFHNHLARWIFCVLRSEPDQDFHVMMVAECEVRCCLSVVQACCLKCHLMPVDWALSHPYQTFC